MDRIELLHEAAPVLRKSDESANTIVPSEPSHFSVSTHSTSNIASCRNSGLMYLPLSFEDELFTARVYKRNYRHSLLRQLYKSKGIRRSQGRNETVSPVSSIATDKPMYGLDNRTEVASEKPALAQAMPASSQHLNKNSHFFWRNLSDQPGRDWQIPARLEETLSDPIYINSDRLLLLTHCINPSTPIIKACKGESDVSPNMILAGDIDLHAQYESDVLLTAMHVASIHGQMEFIDELLKCGANINELAALAEVDCLYAGWRPLHFAVSRGNQLLTEFLLERGADVSAKGLHGNQPIHVWAINRDRLDILKTLLDHSADINASNFHGLTPLRLARMSCRNHIARDHFNWGGEIDLEPLVKSALLKVIQMQTSGALLDSSPHNGDDSIPRHPGDLTRDCSRSIIFEDVSCVSLPSLDMEFFRLFLAFNGYENARHQVTYDIKTRWYMFPGPMSAIGAVSEIIKYSPEILQFRDLVATFDGTAQLYKKDPAITGRKSATQCNEDLDVVEFRICRMHRNIRMTATIEHHS